MWRQMGALAVLSGLRNILAMHDKKSSQAKAGLRGMSQEEDIICEVAKEINCRFDWLLITKDMHTDAALLGCTDISYTKAC